MNPRRPKFLNISCDVSIVNTDVSGRKINPTTRISIPEEHYAYLAQIFSNEIHSLNEMFHVNWVV